MLDYTPRQIRLFAEAAQRRENRQRRDYMGDVRSAVWAEPKDFKDLMKEPEGG